jgi:hypothetical protein
MTYTSSVDRWPWAVVAGAGLAVADGALVGVVANAGREPFDPVLGAVALGVVVAAPGLVALLGLRDRPQLWLAAGCAAMPLSFLSFAGLTLPLLPAAVLCVLGWARHGVLREARPLVHPIISTALVVVLLLGAAVALFAMEDPASWTSPTGSSSTSDITTNGEAAISLAAVLIALGAGWVLNQPRPLRR